MSFSVAAPPEFIVDKTFEDHVTLKAGSSAVLEVAFKASPQPTCKWHFNGGMLRDVRRMKVETIKGMSCVSLTRIEREDAGNYSLHLENRHGRNTMTMKITVLGKIAPTCKLTYTFIYPFIYLFIYLFIYSFIYLFFHLFIYFSIYLLVYLSICLCIYYSFIDYSYINLNIYSFI